MCTHELVPGGNDWGISVRVSPVWITHITCFLSMEIISFTVWCFLRSHDTQLNLSQ